MDFKEFLLNDKRQKKMSVYLDRNLSKKYPNYSIFYTTLLHYIGDRWSPETAFTILQSEVECAKEFCVKYKLMSETKCDWALQALIDVEHLIPLETTDWDESGYNFNLLTKTRFLMRPINQFRDMLMFSLNAPAPVATFELLALSWMDWNTYIELRHDGSFPFFTYKSLRETLGPTHTNAALEQAFQNLYQCEITNISLSSMRFSLKQAPIPALKMNAFDLTKIYSESTRNPSEAIQTFFGSEAKSNG